VPEESEFDIGAGALGTWAVTYDPIGSFWHYTPFRLGEYPDGGRDGNSHGPEDAAARAETRGPQSEALAVLLDDDFLELEPLFLMRFGARLQIAFPASFQTTGCSSAVSFR
jgi:hypothetical protein